MEVDNDETTLQCFKIPYNIVGNLKISCDFTNSIIVFWSKYQLFIYPNLNFSGCNLRKFEPEYEVVDVIVVGDCLVCLDCSGNLNVESVDPFIWRQNIKCISACELMNKRYIVSLQYEGSRGWIWINEISKNCLPNEGNEVQLNLPDEDWMTPEENSIIVCGHLESKYSTEVQNIFNVVESDLDCLLVLITFAKRTLYAILYPRQGVHNPWGTAPNAWLKLYKSHIDIVNIKITMTGNISILIGLSGGNIVKIPLLLKNQKPEVYHLNATINKFVLMGNSLIYTDALTLWKNENAFSQADSTFEQFKVRNVRDFCVIKNLIICITFSNLIYSFDVRHRSSYLDSTDPVRNYYCDVGMVTNSDYLNKIMDTIKKNEELIRKINRESEYLMALSLSERKDVMDDLIQVKASVYDDYRDLNSKHCNLTLTDSLDAYYDSESYYFLINVLVNKIQHKLNKLLSDVLDDLKIHITLSEHRVFKTTSIQIKEQLTTKNFVIPLKRKNRNITRIHLNVKIITNVPGKYDENQNQYTVLYQKHLELNAENFINLKTSTNSVLLKEEVDTLDMLIYKRAVHLNGEYKFEILPDYQSNKWNFFVMLPNRNLTLKDILDLKPLDSTKASFSFKDLWKRSKDKNCLEFQVGKANVKLHIEGDNLMVISPDIMVASDIKNFFSRIIFNTYKDQLSNKFLDHKYYTTIENLKRDIRDCVDKRKSMEEFTILLTRFLRTVYCLKAI